MPNISLDVLEEKRRRLQEAHFENLRAQNHFQTPLSAWKDLYTSQEHRSFYRVPRFFDLNEVKNIATSQCLLVSANTQDSLQIYLVRESVTHFETDAVINAANETLLGGGGVDGAIHQGAGPTLLKDCAFLKGCKTGDAVITKGYDLPAKYVLHTVGPILQGPGLEDTASLRKCYESCLTLCDQYHLTSLAIPCIACGVYGYPLDKSAHLVKKILQEYVDKGSPIVRHVILSVLGDREWSAYFPIFT